MSASSKRRLQQLEQMQQSLCMLHGEIRYTGEELPEIFEHLCGRTDSPFSEFYDFLSEKMRKLDGEALNQLWKTGIDRSLKKTYLKKEDRQLLLELGGQMGYLDTKMQLSSIENTLAQLEVHIGDLKKSQNQRQKLSVAFGFLTGFFIMILLI